MASLIESSNQAHVPVQRVGAKCRMVRYLHARFEVKR